MTNTIPPDARNPRLPASYTMRPPMEEDVQAIIDLTYACEIAETDTAERYEPDEIRRDWENMHPETDAWCIFSPEGKIVAYGLFWSHDVAAYGRYWSDGYVHPDYKGRGLGDALIRLIETRATEELAVQPEGTRQVLVNNIPAGSPAARALLETHNYELTRVYFTMHINLAGVQEPPRWPDGISLRVCDGSEKDIRSAHEVIEEGFQDHFAHTPRSFEEWQEELVRESFDPSLWFFALDGEKIVGSALCRVRDPEAGHGWITQLAVRSAWRKRGIASTLLRHAFHAFAQRGCKRVGLGVDGQSLTGAQRLYEQVGMRVTQRIGRYEKELRAGRELHPGRIS